MQPLLQVLQEDSQQVGSQHMRRENSRSKRPGFRQLDSQHELVLQQEVVLQQALLSQAGLQQVGAGQQAGAASHGTHREIGRAHV